MKIGIFGGTFNPVHHGHVAIAEKAIADLGLDVLHVVPANESPFKPGSSLVKVPWNRLEMLRNAFSGMEQATIDTREIERGGVSYAVDTVSEIARENPGAELFFIIGEDCSADLPKWKDFERLESLCRFVVYPRTEESSSATRELFAAAGIEENADEKIVGVVKAGLLKRHGFCPCRLPSIPENFCPCAEFREQAADPNFHGLCYCRLYFKP